MDIEFYGGNRVKKINQPIVSKETQLSSGRYNYSLVRLNTKEKWSSKSFKDLTAYIIKGKSLAVKGYSKPFVNGQVLQAGQEEFEVENLTYEEVQVLLAWSSEASSGIKGFSLTPENEIKRVNKPWGYELWLAGEDRPFAFKKISIKAGTKTSLQYHEFKKETNLLYEGAARLHYKKESGAEYNGLSDIDSAELQAPSVVDVEPHTIHRLEAKSDILLFEVSTPELDDVIRLSDDAKRAHGRIEAEHRGN